MESQGPIGFVLPPARSAFARRLGRSVGLWGFHRRLLPQCLGHRQRFDLALLPPCHFIAGLMQLPVMTAAQRHRELVADLEAQRSGLRKAHVMRVE
jgi:hypothetical protein